MKLKTFLGFDPTPKTVYRHRIRMWERVVDKLKADLRQAETEKVEAIKQFRIADMLEKKAQKQLADAEQKIASDRNKMAQMRKEIRRGIAEATRLQKELNSRNNQIAALRQNLSTVRSQADNYAKEVRKVHESGEK